MAVHRYHPLFIKKGSIPMPYRLIRSDRKTIAIEIKNGELLVRAPKRASREQIDRFVADHKAWIETHLAKARAQQQAASEQPKLMPEDLGRLAEKARIVIPQRVAHYAPLVGVTYGKITVRSQRTRWGSCSSKGDLSFNCLLLLAPPPVLDSVVVHELCHRKEMNHSGRFYEEVLREFPEYRQWNRWLKENGPLLMAMLPEK